MRCGRWARLGVPYTRIHPCVCNASLVEASLLRWYCRIYYCYGPDVPENLVLDDFLLFETARYPICPIYPIYRGMRSDCLTPSYSGTGERRRRAVDRLGFGGRPEKTLRSSPPIGRLLVTPTHMYHNRT